MGSIMPAPRPLRRRRPSKRGPVSHALPFTFLHISSGLARKGIEELITAYCIAFSNRAPVLLVIKTISNSSSTVDAAVARVPARL